MTAAAVEHELARAVGEPGVALGVLEVGAHLEEASRIVARPGEMTGGELVGFADVEDREVGAPEQLRHLLGRDLPNLAERVAHEIG